MSAGALYQPVRPARRRDRLQLFTVVFVSLAVLTLLGAMTSQNNMLFWLVGVAIGSIVVSGMLAGPAMMSVRLGGVRAAQLSRVGQPAPVVVTLLNIHRRRTVHAVRLEARFIGPRGSKRVVRAGLPSLPPNESTSVTLRIIPPDRGRWTLGSLRVSTTFPFGISHKVLIFEPALSTIALPEPAQGDPATEADANSVENLAQHIRRATEGDTHAIREYRSGDPRRLIAWRASSRTGQLMIREQSGTGTRSVWLRPRAEAAQLAAREPAAERTVAVTLAAGERAQQDRIRVGLWHPETGVMVPPSTGTEWKLALAQLGDRSGSGATAPPAGATVLQVDSADRKPSETDP